MLWQIFLQIILIGLNAALSCAETAIISINDARLDKLASNGDKRAVRLKKVTSRPTRLLTSVHISTTVFCFLGAALASYSFTDRLSGRISGAFPNIPGGVSGILSAVLIALILACLTIVLGELVPRKVAAKRPEKLALRLAGFVRLIQVLFAPLVWFMNITANGLLRLIGIDPEKEEDTVTEEEIIMMSDAGAEKGTIDEDENRIIKNVFAFDDMTAEQLCTHRTDVSVLWSSEEVEVWEETIHRTRHSAFPVCGESVDNVIGILNAKDYFRLDDKSRENIMENAVHEPYFVHENMKADRLFAQMKKKGADHFAVVVDEYGGMTGIITVTDLVEQLVGEFDDDELDEPEAEFEKTGDDQWLVPGSTPLNEVCEELGAALPADKYDTFGGYVIAGLGEIPKDGTRTFIECDGLRIDILEIHHHRAELCRVTKMKPADENSGEAPEA